MKKHLIYGSTIAAAGLLANTANAIDLNSLIVGNGTISIGDKIFGDFGFGIKTPASAPGQTASASDLNVSVGRDESENYFIQFAGVISSGLGGFADLSLQYSVNATGGWTINAIDQSFNFGAGGNGGTITIAESGNATGFPPVGNDVAHSTVSYVFGASDANDPVAEVGDQLTVPNLTKLFVRTDIHLFAFDSGSIVDASIINQSFHQTPPQGVPDGGSTLCLFAAAMGVLPLIRGSRR